MTGDGTGHRETYFHALEQVRESIIVYLARWTALPSYRAPPAIYT